MTNSHSGLAGFLHVFPAPEISAAGNHPIHQQVISYRFNFLVRHPSGDEKFPLG
jgi:hypothetical protein